VLSNASEFLQSLRYDRVSWLCTLQEAGIWSATLSAMVGEGRLGLAALAIQQLLQPGDGFR